MHYAANSMTLSRPQHVANGKVEVSRSLFKVSNSCETFKAMRRPAAFFKIVAYDIGLSRDWINGYPKMANQLPSVYWTRCATHLRSAITWIKPSEPC